MSLWSHLAQWVAPFLPRFESSTDTEARRRQLDRQTRENAIALRQLRAELRLMRMWKADSERRDD